MSHVFKKTHFLWMFLVIYMENFLIRKFIHCVTIFVVIGYGGILHVETRKDIRK